MSVKDGHKPERNSSEHAEPLEVSYDNGVLKFSCTRVERKDALTYSGYPLHEDKHIERVHLLVEKNNDS